MKKIYILFSFVLLAFVAVGQNTTIFDFTNPAQLESWGIVLPQSGNGTDLHDKTVTVDGVSVSFIKGTASNDCRIWNGGGEYDARTYKNSKIKISSVRNISKIEFEFSKDKSMHEDGNLGTYTGPGKGETIGVWTGDGTEITFASSKASFKRIIVYEEVGQVSPMPVFSHESGTYFSSLDLNISNAMGTNFLIRYDYQVYTDGVLTTDSQAKGQTFSLTLPLVKGKVTTYDVDVTVTKASQIPSQKVRKTYVLREKGPERIFEKVNSIKQMTDGSNFIILNQAGDRIMTSVYDHTSKFEAAPCKVANGLVNTGEVIDPMIFKLVNLPNTEKCRLKVDGQDLYLCLNGGSNGFNLSTSPEMDLSTEWILRPTDLQIENGYKTSKYVTYYEREDMFSFYSRSNDNLITIYKERINGEPLPKYCPNPQFSLRPGQYVGGRTLTISSELEGCGIYVTMRRNGTTVYNNKYLTAPATLNLDVYGQECTYDIEARVTRSGYSDSEVIRKGYTILDDPFQDCLKAQIVMAEVAADKGWLDGNKYETMTFRDQNGHNINFAVTGGGNDGKYYASDKTWRLYAEGQMRITLPAGYYFNHIEFFFSKGTLANAVWSNGQFYPSEGIAKNSWAPSELISDVTITAKSKTQITGLNVFYTSNTSGVEETAVKAQILGVNGGVRIWANEETAVAVYSLAGQLVGQYNVAAGEQEIELPCGFYIVRAGEQVEKVIVK